MYKAPRPVPSRPAPPRPAPPRPAMAATWIILVQAACVTAGTPLPTTATVFVDKTPTTVPLSFTLHQGVLYSATLGPVLPKGILLLPASQVQIQGVVDGFVVAQPGSSTPLAPNVVSPWMQTSTVGDNGITKYGLTLNCSGVPPFVAFADGYGHPGFAWGAAGARPRW